MNYCHTTLCTLGLRSKLTLLPETWLRNSKSLIQQRANSAFHSSGIGKWVPASAGKAKAGMVHSVSGWTRGVQVKLWDPLRTRAIPERLRGVITTRRYTNPRLPLPYLVIHMTCECKVSVTFADGWRDDRASVFAGADSRVGTDAETVLTVDTQVRELVTQYSRRQI